jgi:hypothetical protein
VRKWWQIALYIFFGGVAVVADFYKWPIVDYQSAFWIMVVALSLLVALTIGLILRRDKDQLTDSVIQQPA